MKAHVRPAAVALVAMIFGVLASAPPLPAPARAAQQPAAPSSQSKPQEPEQTLRVQVQLVNLFATVRDKHNGLVGNLNKENFHVFEDGQEQKIAYFAREVTLPVTLAMLIDTSGSQSNLLGAEQDGSMRFLQRVMRKGDMAMVISFDLDVDLLADFTSDREELERAIRRTRINAPSTPAMVQGPLPDPGPRGTDLYDAVYLACREKLSSEAGRKGVIILTDAQDYGSKVKLPEAIEAAQRSDAVIHVLLIADVGQYGGFGFGAYQGASVAKKMAEETGGRMIEIRNEKKLEQAFDEISQELRSQYILGYYPSNTARDGSFRRIRVETNEHHKVLARKGYYAPRN